MILKIDRLMRDLKAHINQTLKIIVEVTSNGLIIDIHPRVMHCELNFVFLCLYKLKFF